MTHAVVKLTLTLGFLVILSGCSAVSTRPLTSTDPLESVNRSVFAVNERLSVGNAKREHGRFHPVTLATNVFDNVHEVPDAINHLLQAKPKAALDDGMRLAFNSTFGLGGVLDVASEMGIAKQKEDFGQTLGYWQVPAGPYLVMPLIGSTTVRDLAARPVDAVWDPLSYNNTAWVLQKITPKQPQPDEPTVQPPQPDLYAARRDAWLGYRQKQIAE